MPVSPTGIIPQEFNTQRDLPRVIEWLQALPAPASDKVELLFGWARNVGLKLKASDYNQVRFKGSLLD